MNARIVGDDGSEIITRILEGRDEAITEKSSLGRYMEQTTGLLVCVLFHQHYRIGRTQGGQEYKVATTYEYRTEAGQPCFCEGDPGDGSAPNILRCPTNHTRAADALYLIRQR